MQKTILNKSKKKKSFPEVFKEDGTLICNKLEIANKFNIYFTKIGTNLAKKIICPDNKDYMKSKYSSVFSFSEIETRTVETILDKLKTKSSYRWDGMSVKLLKAIKSVLTKPLTVIINQMLKTGIFPDKLKIPRVIPLYKKDDESSFSNYRPISLLPATGLKPPMLLE